MGVSVFLNHTLGMSANDYGVALVPYFVALILGAAIAAPASAVGLVLPMALYGPCHSMLGL